MGASTKPTKSTSAGASSSVSSSFLRSPPRAPLGRPRGPRSGGGDDANGVRRRRLRGGAMGHYEVEAAWFTVWMIVAGVPCPAKKSATALSTAWPTLVGKAMSK